MIQWEVKNKQITVMSRVSGSKEKSQTSREILRIQDVWWVMDDVFEEMYEAERKSVTEDSSQFNLYFDR